MAILAGVLNGKNIDRDFDFQSIPSFLCSQGVRKGFDDELEVQAGLVKKGQAFVSVSRSVVLHTETLLIPVQITADTLIDTATDGEIVLRVEQTSVDNGTVNTEAGDNIAVLEKVSALPSDSYIHLATISGGVIEDKREFATLNSDIVSALEILSDTDVQTIVQSSLDDGTISLPSTLSSFWDNSNIPMHAVRGFSFFNPYQYIYGTSTFYLYDLARKGNWSIPSLRSTGGGGFYNSSQMYYCTASTIRRATLNADGTTTVDTLTGVSGAGCSIFPKNGKLYVNNNAGQTVSNVLTTASTLNATYNSSTKKITYSVVSGTSIDFSTEFNVGDSVAITGSINAINNRSRIVTAVGLNFVEFNAPDVTEGVPLTVTKTGGGGTVSGQSFSYQFHTTELHMNASGLQAGDSVTVSQSVSAVPSNSYYSAINGFIENNAVSHSETFTASSSTKSISVTFKTNTAALPLLDVNGSVSASRVVNGGANEPNNNNISMIAGGAASRIIRAYDVVGDALVEDTASTIYLPFELDGLCDQFSIDDDDSVLMNATTKISAVYRTDGTFEVLNTSTTPTYGYMSYVEATKRAYLVNPISNVYNISPFPLS